MAKSKANQHRIDLNLLPVFLTLMRERNVTRAGASLNLSQPATSASLARLRAAFQDPLFVQNGRNLEPTSRAETLALELGPSLEAISATIAGSTAFDPTTGDHIFHIGCTEDILLACLPLFRELRSTGPYFRVVVHAANYRTIPLLLETGDINMAVGYMDDHLPASARRRVLWRGGFKVLRDANSDGPVDLDMFCRRPHIVITPRGDLQGFVDPVLQKLGRERKVLLGLPDFGVLPQLLRGSQNLCTVNDLLAKALSAPGSGLAADEPPFDLESTMMHIAWRGAVDRHPAERWIRARLIEHMQQL